MKKLITLFVTFIFALSLALPFSAEARTHRTKSSKGQSSYKVSKRNHKSSTRSRTKKNGTHVKAHKRSKVDNWSIKGNENP